MRLLLVDAHTRRSGDPDLHRGLYEERQWARTDPAPGRPSTARRRIPETMPSVSLRRVAPAGRPRLETALLRRSVDDSVAARHRCAHCRRTPLTGEVVHLYGAPGGEERLVCDLCRPQRRGAPPRGPPAPPPPPPPAAEGGPPPGPRRPPPPLRPP